jgi:hypothetical protein
MYSLLTGVEFTPEREREIFGLSEEEWFVRQEQMESLGKLTESELDHLVLEGIKAKLAQKEAQNERTHNQEI